MAEPTEPTESLVNERAEACTRSDRESLDERSILLICTLLLMGSAVGRCGTKRSGSDPGRAFSRNSSAVTPRYLKSIQPHAGKIRSRSQRDSRISTA